MSQSTYLLDSFHDDDCTYCDGDLVAEDYKSNEAIVCDDCGTPVVQLW